MLHARPERREKESDVSGMSVAMLLYDSARDMPMLHSTDLYSSAVGCRLGEDTQLRGCIRSNQARMAFPPSHRPLLLRINGMSALPWFDNYPTVSVTTAAKPRTKIDTLSHRSFLC